MPGFFPQRPARAAVLGAVGGALAGAAALVTLLAAQRAAGVMGGGAREWVVPLNAVGALLVRWLQIGQSQAFDGLYPDATPLGAAAVVLGGALAGACLGAMLARAPGEPRRAWALAAAVVLWAVTRWALAPALDPVLLREVDGRALFAAWLAWGACVGAWLDAAERLTGGRRPS